MTGPLDAIAIAAVQTVLPLARRSATAGRAHDAARHGMGHRPRRVDDALARAVPGAGDIVAGWTTPPRLPSNSRRGIRRRRRRRRRDQARARARTQIDRLATFDPAALVADARRRSPTLVLGPSSALDLPEHLLLCYLRDYQAALTACLRCSACRRRTASQPVPLDRAARRDHEGAAGVGALTALVTDPDGHLREPTAGSRGARSPTPRLSPASPASTRWNRGVRSRSPTSWAREARTASIRRGIPRAAPRARPDVRSLTASTRPRAPSPIPQCSPCPCRPRAPPTTLSTGSISRPEPGQPDRPVALDEHGRSPRGRVRRRQVRSGCCSLRVRRVPSLPAGGGYHRRVAADGPLAPARRDGGSSTPASRRRAHVRPAPGPPAEVLIGARSAGGRRARDRADHRSRRRRRFRLRFLGGGGVQRALRSRLHVRRRRVHPRRGDRPDRRCPCQPDIGPSCWRRCVSYCRGQDGSPSRLGSPRARAGAVRRVGRQRRPDIRAGAARRAASLHAESGVQAAGRTRDRGRPRPRVRRRLPRHRRRGRYLRRRARPRAARHRHQRRWRSSTPKRPGSTAGRCSSPCSSTCRRSSSGSGSP